MLNYQRVCRTTDFLFQQPETLQMWFTFFRGGVLWTATVGSTFRCLVGFNGNKPLVFCWASTWIHPLCWLVVKNPRLITGKSGLCWNKGHEIVGPQHVSAYGHSTWQLAMKKSGVKQHPSCWNFDWLFDFAYNVCLPPANPAFPYEKEWFLVVSHTNT